MVILLYCLLVPIFSRYDPDAVNFAIAKEDPSLQHPSARTSTGATCSCARLSAAASRS